MHFRWLPNVQLRESQEKVFSLNYLHGWIVRLGLNSKILDNVFEYNYKGRVICGHIRVESIYNSDRLHVQKGVVKVWFGSRNFLFDQELGE